MIYTISELLQKGISRSTVRTQLSFLVEHGLARRCDPGRGSSPWLIDEAALTYLKSRGQGRPRIKFSAQTKEQALATWEKNKAVSRVADSLGVSWITARRFLEREGKLEPKKASGGNATGKAGK